MSIERLSEIQRNLNVAKDRTNDFGKYKYRNAEDILKAVKTELKESEAIILTNDLVDVGPRLFVKATAILQVGEGNHAAVAFAELAAEKKGMDPSQVTGSATSYANKYALGNLLGISDGVDADATNTHGNDPKEINFQDFKFTFGKYNGIFLHKLPKEDALNYVGFLYQSAAKDGKKDLAAQWLEASKWVQSNM